MDVNTLGRSVYREETRRPESTPSRRVSNVLSNHPLYEILGCKTPVEQVVDHGCDIVGATVLIVEIVGVFPDINSENWFLATG